MFKKIMLMMLVSAVLDVNAMELCNESAIQKKEEAFCYLEELPVDIQNYIAMFLKHETKEEFIKRARRMDCIKDQDNISLIFRANKEYCGLAAHLGKSIVYCPGKNQAGSIQYGSSYTVFKFSSKNSGHVLEIPVTGYQHFPCFAISEYGKFVGKINPLLSADSGGKRVFSLINIATCASRDILLEVNNVNTLAFNRQGTAAIVFGTKEDLTTGLNVEKYQIIPLKIKDNNLVIKKTDKKDRSLQHYFGKKMVCKALKNSSSKEI